MNDSTIKIYSLRTWIVDQLVSPRMHGLWTSSITLDWLFDKFPEFCRILLNFAHSRTFPGPGNVILKSKDFPRNPGAWEPCQRQDKFQLRHIINEECKTTTTRSLEDPSSPVSDWGTKRDETIVTVRNRYKNVDYVLAKSQFSYNDTERW